MDSIGILRAYKAQSYFYDPVFHPFYGPGQARAVRAMALKPGDRVLEVGAGTGLSLRHYPEGVQFTGIDLSEPMLARARMRAHDLEMKVDFQIMDAQNMSFADHSFDHVVAMHLASVVPEPARLISEMRRVCRPGGTLTLLNHLCSDSLPTRFLRFAMGPLRSWLGFRPLYSRSELLRHAGSLNWKELDAKRHGFVVLQAIT